MSDGPVSPLLNADWSKLPFVHPARIGARMPVIADGLERLLQECRSG